MSFLKIKNLSVDYPMRKETVYAAKDVNIEVNKGEILGLVGESGSGKTSLVLAILKLIASTGKIEFDEFDLNLIKKNTLKNLRKNIQIVFQDPFSSLSPRMNVQEILNEGIDVHFPKYSELEKKQILKDILKETGMDYDHDHNKYPHEFSGGQRQRIAIARALILKPKILILDEPTSALDMTVQVQIVNLLRKLQKKYGIAFLFISHDLKVVRALSHKVLVMRQGNIVEAGTSEQIFAAPKTEYAKTLVAAAFGVNSVKKAPG